MFKTILVPLDGSERAEAILPHAQDLAQRCDAQVLLLRVVEPVYGTMGTQAAAPVLDGQLLEQEMSNAESYLAGILLQLQEKGINAKKRVVYGSVVSSIIEAAKQEKADLIAMASHGRTGIARVFYGSVAAGVLQSVDRALLLVRSLDG
jgi:nucleotide-binding universal stress UspA family protein